MELDFWSFLLLIPVIFFAKRLIAVYKARIRASILFEKLRVFQAARLQRIKATSGLKSGLSEELKAKIIRSDGCSLFRMLNNGLMSSYDLLLVFYQRAITIGLGLNALAEVNIENALEQAKKCDETREKLRKTEPEKLESLPPLYGVPMSIKSTFEVKGLSNSIGCASLISRIPDKNGLILDLLIAKTGIIPFVTSTVPQCLMLNETTSRVYGRCKSPWNEERTSGGSSGGEASLLASGCSPIGFGNDIGGSIRIPCLYSGLYGIKVTSGRLTLEGDSVGNSSNRRGNINIRSCNTPMGKSVQDLAVVLRSLFVKELWEKDPEVAPIPWREEEYIHDKKLRVGYILDDPFFAVSKGNQRAVNLAAKALERKGHELVKLEFPNFEAATLNYLAIMSSAGKFRPYREMMGDEPPVPEYNQMIGIMKIPRCFRSVLAFVLRLIGEKRAAKVLPRTAEKSAWEFFQESEKQQVIRKQFFDWWRDNRLDALISPGLPSPAIRHGDSVEAFVSCCYTFFFNLVDFPTGAVPICKVEKLEEVYEDKGNRDKYERKMRESMMYSQGMPLGVQVSTLPYQEERCLNVMRQVEEGIGFHELPIKD